MKSTYALRFVMVFVFVALICAAEGFAQAYRWNTVRIGGGGATTSLKAHPRVKDLFFMTTDVGNAYRWNAQQEQWEGLLNAVPASQWNTGAAGGIAVDPNDPDGQVLYATVGKYAFDGANGGRVIKSTNRGRTWKDTGLSLKVQANKDQMYGDRIVVDPNNSDVVYVSSFSDGTYRTEDAGHSWTKISPLNGAFIGFDVTGGKIKGRTRIVVIGCPDGVYRSEDGGQRFSLMPGSPNQVRRASFGGGVIYVSTDHGVFRYKKNWKDISPEKTAYIALASNPVAGSELIISTNNGRKANFYLSKDAGDSWIKLIKKPDFSEVPFAQSSHFSLSTFDLCWDPFYQNRVWFSDFFNAYQTINVWEKEVTWKARAIGHEEVVTLGVLVCPASGSNALLSCVADLGGFDHADITQPPKSSMYQFFPWLAPGVLSGNMTGVAIQENNPDFIARVGRRGWDGVGIGGWSDDGGIHYQQWRCPADAKGGRIAISAGNETMIWATQDGPVYRSADRGNLWEKVTAAPDAVVGPGNTFVYINPLAADKVNPDKFYLYKAGVFYVSSDGGRSFVALNSSLPTVSNVGLMKIETSPGVEGDVWLSLERAGLFHSVDSGASFKRIEGVSYARLFACGKGFGDGYAIYVLGTVNGIKDGVFRSDDAGKTWLRIDTAAYRMGMEPNSMAADRLSPGKLFIGTNGNGIYVGEPKNKF